MLENLYLNPDLLGRFLTDQSPSWSGQSIVITSDEVESFWNSLDNVPRYGFGKRGVSIAAWQQEAHGAHILADTVGHFSGYRLEYRKVEHGLLLARTAIDSAPDLLRPVKAVLEQAFESMRATR